MYLNTTKTLQDAQAPPAGQDEYSHGWRSRGLGVVLGVNLRGGDLWVARRLGVGGPTVALRRRRRLVVEAEVVLFIVPAGRRKTQRVGMKTERFWFWFCWSRSGLPGRCVGVAGVPGAALTRSPAPIMQRGLGAVVRRSASCRKQNQQTGQDRDLNRVRTRLNYSCHHYNFSWRINCPRCFVIINNVVLRPISSNGIIMEEQLSNIEFKFSNF